MAEWSAEERFPVDLGDGHRGRISGWHPDRDLNPQYDGIPDVEEWGMEILHTSPAGSPCAGFVTFDGEVQRQVEPNRPNRWTVESRDPLTLSPSVLCSCGDHGFIREGRWVRA
jgi:hypothetical protein